MSSIVVCPKCACQLEVKVSFASGPKSTEKAQASDEIGGLLNSIDENVLNDWERGFYNDFKAKYDKYKDQTYLSDKQRSTLEKMAEKGF